MEIDKIEVVSFAVNCNGTVQPVNKIVITTNAGNLELPIDRSMTIDDITNEFKKLDLTKFTYSIALDKSKFNV